MSVFQGVIKEELERAKSHVANYETLLSALPKGYVSLMRISGKRFAYWKWREGPKIKSRYLGPEGSEEEKKARNDYQERKRLEANLRIAKKEAEKYAKVLKYCGKE